jgi:hypothetical protein
MEVVGDGHGIIGAHPMKEADYKRFERWLAVTNEGGILERTLE